MPSPKLTLHPAHAPKVRGASSDETWSVAHHTAVQFKKDCLDVFGLVNLTINCTLYSCIVNIGTLRWDNVDTVLDKYINGIVKWHADTVYSAVPLWGSVKRKPRTHLESYKWHVVCLCAGERSWNLANTFINPCCKKQKTKLHLENAMKKRKKTI